MQALLEANPQLNHALNDPELLRQQMEAIRNPAVMQVCPVQIALPVILIIFMFTKRKGNAS